MKTFFLCFQTKFSFFFTIWSSAKSTLEISNSKTGQGVPSDRAWGCTKHSVKKMGKIEGLVASFKGYGLYGLRHGQNLPEAMAAFCLS
jgi:hypothetical protein